ncbi:hypothetical protein EVAR_49357_1 [Eumeta japonica]|uniref:Uncharacterized protein n=1 Tax=Eumeta variegata TaxID=151549 RepID=A0A4C1XWI9_EUMVA|nr:hypothetical protein EVAR_49357_1 [Eumeta japonica]
MFARRPPAAAAPGAIAPAAVTEAEVIELSEDALPPRMQRHLHADNDRASDKNTSASGAAGRGRAGGAAPYVILLLAAEICYLLARPAAAASFVLAGRGVRRSRSRT